MHVATDSATASIFHPLLCRSMVWRAQRLPVRAIPEQRLVSTMRPYVIDVRRWRAPALLGAHHTPRMRGYECFARLIPARIIAALAS